MADEISTLNALAAFLDEERGRMAAKGYKTARISIEVEATTTGLEFIANVWSGSPKLNEISFQLTDFPAAIKFIRDAVDRAEAI